MKGVHCSSPFEEEDGLHRCAVALCGEAFQTRHPSTLHVYYSDLGLCSCMRSCKLPSKDSFQVGS